MYLHFWHSSVLYLAIECVCGCAWQKPRLAAAVNGLPLSGENHIAGNYESIHTLPRIQRGQIHIYIYICIYLASINNDIQFAIVDIACCVCRCVGKESGRTSCWQYRGKV